MNYSIKQLAELSGVTVRTLHWYDKLGLLCPKRSANEYRTYEKSDVDRLQLILFYRELDIPLKTIGRLLQDDQIVNAAGTGRAGGAGSVNHLADHLRALESKRERLDKIIATMQKTIAARKGNKMIDDNEKFAAFKREALAENEKLYGDEVRQKYGTSVVEESNQKFAGLTEEQYAQMQELSAQLHTTLQAAVADGSPTSALAYKAANLHKQWLCFYWSDYSPEKHRSITQMYLEDPRFSVYYEEIAPGAAQFLRDAVWSWLGATEVQSLVGY